MPNCKVVGITGMPGSGKTVFGRLAQERGIPVVVMGDVVREETAKKGLKPTPENVGKTMLELREEYGPLAIAKSCLLKIQNIEGTIVVIEGIRSLEEVKEFRRSLPDFTLVATYTSPKTRYRRLHDRRRSDDPKNWDDFISRDERELRIGIGSAIAIADHVIINEDTLGHFKNEVDKFLAELIQDGSN